MQVSVQIGSGTRHWQARLDQRDRAAVGLLGLQPGLIEQDPRDGAVLLAHQLDRKALRDCAAHDQLLADMILRCQSTIRDYNQRLAEINRAIAAKP